MKKQLLFATGLVAASLLNAQVARQAVKSRIPAQLANKKAQKMEKNLGSEFEPGFMLQTAINNPKQIVANQTAKTSVHSSTVIGQTYYDLQTNSSVGNRIVVGADGTIGAVWTMEATDPGTTYPNRGTGYQYFNGTSWGNAPSARIENARTGWPEITHLGSGKEAVLAHGIAGGKVNICSRPAKGTGAWSNDPNAIPTATTGGNFWPRMVSSGTGDTLYATYLTYPVGSGGAIYQGLDGAVVFSRSTNGGTSWDITNVIPTGLTSASYRGFGGDAYAIAARGPVVAIIAGDSDKDVTMTKSTDGGVTWTSTKVFALPPSLLKWDHTVTTSDYDNDGDFDTLDVSDGTFAIGIDNFNEVHASFGAMRIMQDAVQTTQTWSYFPGTDGLYYWKESYGAASFPNQTAVIVAAIEDLGEQGTIYFPTPSDPNASPWGTFGCSLTSYPSLAFDAANNIYLSYSSIVDSLQSIASVEKNVRHQYVIKSCDQGANFGMPYELDKVVDFVNDVPMEGVYGSLATRVNGSLHMVYQRDFYSGFGVNSTTDADNQGNMSDIVYVNIPTADIACFVGVKETAKNSISELSIYPNPASNNATIEVSLNENNKMEVVIMNNVGQTVYSTTVNGNIGANKVNVNTSNLSAGIYFYQVKVGNNQAVTKKFAVSK